MHGLQGFRTILQYKEQIMIRNQVSTPQQLWTKSFFLICLSNLFIFTSFYCLLPTLPLLITDVLAGDTSGVGYIFGIFALAAVFARPIAGHLLDSQGRKSILRISLFFLTLAVLAYSGVTSLLSLFLLRAVHGVLWGFATTASGTVVTDLVPTVRRGEGIGYYGLSNTLAMAAGPLLGLEVLRGFGFFALFMTSFVFSALGFLCVWGIKHQIAEIPEKGKGIVLFEPRVLSFAAITFFIAVLYGGILSFIVLFGKEINIENPGGYFLAYACTLILSRPYAGKIFDQQGPKKIMVIGFIALLLSFLLLFLATDYLLFMMSAVFFGIGFGIVQPTVLTMAINKVNIASRGVANGTILTAFDLGVGSGSILLGMLAKPLGLPMMYLVSCLIVLIPLVIFYIPQIEKYRQTKS